MNQIRQELYQLLIPYCGTNITEQCNLFEWGINSYNMVELLLEIENIYHIEIKDEELDIRKISSIALLEQFIQQKLQGK